MTPRPRRFGSTISSAVRVLSVLTTLACGKARWTCSPSESVSLTNRVGGKPCEKSSGLEMSRSDLAGQVVGAGRARGPAARRARWSR